MFRHLAANGITVLIVAMLGLAGLIGWGVNEFRRPGPLATPAIVEIPQGARLEQISTLLVKSGAVTNGTVFRLGVRYGGREAAMKFGVYQIPAGASMEAVVQLLAEGGDNARYKAGYVLRADGVRLRLVDVLAPDAPQEKPEETVKLALKAGSSVAFRVTVPEGLTVAQVVDGLGRIETLSGEIGKVPAEGMLAPDTYAFVRDGSRQALVDQMVAAQKAALAAAWSKREEGLPLKSAEEALILASIVEKETGVEGERPVVASVFVNRLRSGMRLETDPTVIYGLTLGKGTLDRGLRQSELRRPTPFNTYLIDGLPPTPIANPGRAALEAVVRPAATSYLFFVADGTGGHVFAETLTEHQKNVVAWRKIEAERQRTAPQP